MEVGDDGWCFVFSAWEDLGWEDYRATQGSSILLFQDIHEFNLTFHDYLTLSRDQGSP